MSLMATMAQKIACEKKFRAIVSRTDLPEPDRIEYGCTCIWVIWEEPKVAVRVDIDVDPDFDYDAQEVLPMGEP
jgi:hypothetical protein